MYSVLIVIHVIISLFLIAVILLQAGKGGGVADTFGGSQMQNLFGTKSTTILTKLTAVCAIGFIVTCISLAVISSRGARSIVDNIKIPQTMPQAAQPLPAKVPTPQGQVSAPQTQVPAPTPLAAPVPVEPAPQGGASEVR